MIRWVQHRLAIRGIKDRMMRRDYGGGMAGFEVWRKSVTEGILFDR